MPCTVTFLFPYLALDPCRLGLYTEENVIYGKTSMPNPVKYKSVGVSIEAYDKLVYIAEKEDRAIGRQLSRMIDEADHDRKERKHDLTADREPAHGWWGREEGLED